MNNDECPVCGSTLADRESRRAKWPEDDIPVNLTKCQFCGSMKCCMCDMGDDVECGNCIGDDE